MRRNSHARGPTNPHQCAPVLGPVAAAATAAPLPFPAAFPPSTKATRMSYRHCYIATHALYQWMRSSLLPYLNRRNQEGRGRGLAATAAMGLRSFKSGYSSHGRGSPLSLVERDEPGGAELQPW